jgi:hypothetical protein
MADFTIRIPRVSMAIAEAELTGLLVDTGYICEKVTLRKIGCRQPCPSSVTTMLRTKNAVTATTLNRYLVACC